MHARYGFRSVLSSASPCDWLSNASLGAWRASSRNMRAAKGCLFDTSQRVHTNSLKHLHLCAVASRSFSKGPQNYKLGSRSAAPFATNTGTSPSDVQSNAADDLKVADIESIQETANAAESDITDEKYSPDSGKFLLSFKCKPCDHRMMRFISKQAYRKGVVIVRCESCSALHLMADNLGWFKTSSGHSKVNVEQLLAEKGETVKKALSELRPDDVKVLQDNLKLIIDLPDSLRDQLSQQQLLS